MSTGERFLCILSFSHQEGKDFFVMHAVVSCQQVKDFYAFCRFHIKREKIFFVMHAIVSCQQVKVFFIMHSGVFMSLQSCLAVSAESILPCKRSLPPRWWVFFTSFGLISSHLYVPVVTDELLR